MSEDPERKLVFRNRWVVNDRLCLSYSYGHDPDRAVQPEWASYRDLPLDQDAFAKAVRVNLRELGVLSGIIRGDDGASIVDVFRSCPDLEMEGDMATIDGHKTYVLRADTDNGEYTLWLDPESGFLPRQIHVCKEGDDLYYGKPLSHVSEERLRSGLPVAPQKKKWTHLVRSVKLQRIGGHNVITGFSSENNVEYVTGGKSFLKGNLQVTGVEVAPDFDGIDAFEMDLIEGATLIARANQGPPLEWREGQAVLSRDGEIVPYRSTRLLENQSPDLDVATWVRGEATSMEALRGKVVILAFWDSAHESSTEVIETLNALARQHGDVAVIAAHSADSDEMALQELVEEQNIAFRVALDKPAENYKGATFERCGVKSVPAIFIIDGEGNVRYQNIPLAAVEQALKSLLGDQ